MRIEKEYPYITKKKNQTNQRNKTKNNTNNPNPTKK